MKRRPVRRAIQTALRGLGYQLIRAPRPQAGAYAVQRELIRADEPVILDIGAHTGKVTERYRALFPRSTIHCFEPFPRSFEALVRNARRDTRTHCHNVAVSGKNGTATLHANLSSSTSSLLSTDDRAALYWGGGLLETRSRIEVTTITVDAFCIDAGISHVDILKMDVQGAELFVLQGARDMLACQKVSLIYTELLLGPTYQGQYTLHEFFSLFDAAGYSLLDFFNPVRRTGRLVQLDAVFLSPALMRESESVWKDRRPPQVESEQQV